MEIFKKEYKMVIEFGINEIVMINQLLVNEDKNKIFDFIKEIFKGNTKTVDFQNYEILISKNEILNL